MFSECNINQVLKITLKNDGQKFVHLADSDKNADILYNNCSSADSAAFMVSTINKCHFERLPSLFIEVW